MLTGTCHLCFRSTGQLTPRFGLRQPTSHVVEMEPPAAAEAANQQPGKADVIELQLADRWTQPQPPAVHAAPPDTPAAAPAEAAERAPEQTGTEGETTGPEGAANPAPPPTAEPQGRQRDHPP